MVSVSEERLAELVNKWKPVLSISDWDIKSVIVRTQWRKSGDIKIDLSNSMAALMIRHDLDPAHLEEVVVHELLHLKLYSLDQLIEESLDALFGGDRKDSKRHLIQGLFMLELETTVQDLTRALLTASGYKGDYLFHRLRKDVASEIENLR